MTRSSKEFVSSKSWPVKHCSSCGEFFKRKPPPSNPSGYSRCKSCDNKASLEFKLKRVDHPCDGCGETCRPQRQRIYNQRSRIRRGYTWSRILCDSCNESRISATRKYADQRERDREAKRRLRQNRRARGRTSNNRPITNPNCVKGSAYRIVLPQGGSLERTDS